MTCKITVRFIVRKMEKIIHSVKALLCLFLLIAGCASEPITTSSLYTPPHPSQLYRYLGFVPKGNGKPDMFAVIIGANTEHRHRGNISLAYQVLIEQSYKRQDIFILDTDDSGPFFPRIDVTSRDAVEALLGYLKDTVEQDDTLLVYITGHGKRVNNQPSVVLNMGEMFRISELIHQLSLINPSKGFLFIDHCYAGESVIPPNCQWNVVTVSTDTTTSWATSFPRLFWNAFRWGEETIEDAFWYAVEHDKGTRSGKNHPALHKGNCANPSVGL